MIITPAMAKKMRVDQLLVARGLAESRYKEVEVGPEGPTLVDFIAGRVPPREASRDVR